MPAAGIAQDEIAQSALSAICDRFTTSSPDFYFLEASSVRIICPAPTEVGGSMKELADECNNQFCREASAECPPCGLQSRGIYTWRSRITPGDPETERRPLRPHDSSESEPFHLKRKIAEADPRTWDGDAEVRKPRRQGRLDDPASHDMAATREARKALLSFEVAKPGMGRTGVKNLHHAYLGPVPSVVYYITSDVGTGRGHVMVCSARSAALTEGSNVLHGAPHVDKIAPPVRNATTCRRHGQHVSLTMDLESVD
ncbi:uncharacterized protein B0T15DRAFT_508583 [Chaetomium strumarium]|uniref:Uncharacterized protein n=1 Tax=Chaetomium strumarium TaxID=1170767 RepID=A0AAJ0GXR8_9PEZI|nr:hypothetical protein B0T15DRAFT_508583 [Chaetomium strumarium]